MENYKHKKLEDLECRVINGQLHCRPKHKKMAKPSDIVKIKLDRDTGRRLKKFGAC